MIVNFWLYSVQVCLQMAIQVCPIVAIQCTMVFTAPLALQCSASGNSVSFPPLVAITGVSRSSYTGGFTCGYAVPFLPLVAIQVFLQVAIQVCPLVAILYHSFHL